MLFLHTISDEEILNELDDDVCDKEKSLHVYKQEVMKTIIDGRYSGKSWYMTRIVLKKKK